MEPNQNYPALFQIIWVRNKYDTWDKEMRQMSDGQLIYVLEQKISNKEYFKRKLTGSLLQRKN